MGMKQKLTIVGVAVVIGITFFGLDEDLNPMSIRQPVDPNWEAITAWPSVQAEVVEARPNPNQRVTAIVLDDSGSMGPDLEPAKLAVQSALGAMDDRDRIAVLALNAGTILPFSSVAEAKALLPALLAPIPSDGTTPLTESIITAQSLLEEEAALVRGFGTFRVIVTTDGQADDDDALDNAIEELARTTPIQVTTIGIGIGGNHVLRREDLGSFVDVENVDALQDALQAAVAENRDFNAITDFE